MAADKFWGISTERAHEIGFFYACPFGGYVHLCQRTTINNTRGRAQFVKRAGTCLFRICYLATALRRNNADNINSSAASIRIVDSSTTCAE